jgi:hypothetical protein|tara:strand:- start:206 stop:553 length:348 start_codon:yes stop_codon:yes gene_type:complete
MIVGIEGELNNGWVFLYNNTGFIASVFTARKERIVLFGNIPEGKTLMFNTSITAETYATEDELEIAVDNFVDEPGYYKSQAESFNPSKFSGESSKYPVIVPIPPIPPEPEPPEIE